MLYELKRIRKENGLTQKQAAQLFEVPHGTYRNWEQGICEPNDNDMIKRIADRFGVPMEALFGYDMMPPGALADAQPETSGMRNVPVVSEIAAGIPVSPDYVEFHMPVPDEVMRRHPRAFLFKVVGTSMDRVLPNGSYALVDPEMRDVVEGRAYAVKINGDAATIKRIRRLANGISLVPDSASDPTWACFEW